MTKRLACYHHQMAGGKRANLNIKEGEEYEIISHQVAHESQLHGGAWEQVQVSVSVYQQQAIHTLVLLGSQMGTIVTCCQKISTRTKKIQLGSNSAERELSYLGLDTCHPSLLKLEKI